MAAYIEEYPMAGAYGVFGLTSRTNFQVVNYRDLILQKNNFARKQFWGGSFELTSHTNFQYYPPSGGYKTYHTERTVRYREFLVYKTLRTSSTYPPGGSYKT